MVEPVYLHAVEKHEWSGLKLSMDLNVNMKGIGGGYVENYRTCSKLR